MKTHLKWFDFQLIYAQDKAGKAIIQIHILPATHLPSSRDVGVRVSLINPDVLVLRIDQKTHLNRSTSCKVNVFKL